MTEETWLTWTDPEEFLRALALVSECPQNPVPNWLHSIAGQLTSRKLRLFAVACCRRLEPLGLDPRLVHAMDVVEMNIGAGTNVSRKRRNAVKRSLSSDPAWADMRAPSIICALIGSSAARVAAYTSWHCCRYCSPKDSDVALQERIAQGKLLRDIVGNPFRPVPLDTRWLAPPVIALAQTIYAEGQWQRMPSLGEELILAGCNNDEIIEHCRSDGPHVRGCWVVDLILNKV